MAEKKFTYKVNGQPVNLAVDTDHIAVKFSKPFPKSLSSTFVNNNDHLGELTSRIEIPGEEFTIYKLSEIQEERSKRFSNAMASLLAANEVNNAMPVFISGNKRVVATDKIIVGFKKGSKAAKSIVKKFDCEEIESSYDSSLLKIPENRNLFELIEEIEKEKGSGMRSQILSQLVPAILEELHQK